MVQRRDVSFLIDLANIARNGTSSCIVTIISCLRTRVCLLSLVHASVERTLFISFASIEERLSLNVKCDPGERGLGVGVGSGGAVWLIGR